jgi:hypothetical protein
VRLPLEELVDLSRVGPGTRAPTPREIREALPRGWVLEEDGRHARRDTRLLFREGWVLILGLVSFGAAGIGFFWWSAPRGGGGFVRFAIAVALVLFAGGIVGPIVTRALQRK